jgi:hypothetical protein
LSGLEYEEEGSYYVKMFKKVKSIADTGVSLAKFNDNMIKSFDTDDTENGYTTSKLMQLHFVYGLCSLSDKQRNDLLTEMLYLAMKKGPKFGPFGKLY